MSPMELRVECVRFAVGLCVDPDQVCEVALRFENYINGPGAQSGPAQQNATDTGRVLVAGQKGGA